MKKVDPTVIKETLYVLGFSLIMSALMQIVFLLVGRWDFTVLFGNLLGIVASVGNFFLMGLTIQSALEKEEKDAKNQMKLSQSMRLLMLFVIAVVGYMVPVFNTIAVVVPYLFPRVCVMIRTFVIKDKGE
ncbi:MAG: hypothetical protein E7388_08445 [Ruminococcaceae bacterium]|nr:hypothetical protein [Oscillospiraceae bacterium]